MKKFWFFNVAGGVALLAAVAVNRPAAVTPTATCAPACAENKTSASLQEMAFGVVATPATACASTCAAACDAVSDTTGCPPIWLLLPRNPIDVFANRLRSMDATLAVNPAQPNNVLVLNGKAFDFNKCSSMGALELVEGSPDATDSKPIPFTAYLIHNGKVVKQGVSNPDQSVLLLNMNEMLKLAQPGDELQIRPSCRSGKPLNFCASGGC